MSSDIEKGFIEAYDLYADAIYRHCFFRGLTKEQATDLTQDSFTKLWVYLSEGNEVQNVRALLYKIATNLIIDNSRKKKEEQLDFLLENKQIDEPSYPGHKQIKDQAALSDIMDHIKDFPDDDRQLVLMRYVDDLDPKDISIVTGLTVNHISVKLHRIAKKLRLDHM